MATRPKDRSLTDMAWFFRTTDWLELWEEFYLSIGEDGLSKHKTIKSFAKLKAKNPRQYEFLLWRMGPVLPDDPRTEKFSKFAKDGPQDWKKRRQEGGWFNKKAIETLNKEIKLQTDSLAVLRNVGEKFLLSQMAKVQALSEQLDTDFKDRLLIDGLPYDKNLARARAYLRFKEELQSIQGRWYDMYAKSLGINFEDMTGLGQLIAASAMMSQLQGKETKASHAMQQIAEMVINKAARYDLPLPEEAEKKILEITATEADEKETEKKKQVQ